MADLKTNYVDDVLDTTKNQLRKYQQIQNDDGTVSFVDVTEYTQVGTSFGAKDINDTNAAINDVNRKLDNVEVILTDRVYLYKYGSIRILNIDDAPADKINRLTLPDDSIPNQNIRNAIFAYDDSQKNYAGLIRFLKSKSFFEVLILNTYASSPIIATKATTKINGELVWMV